MKKQKLKKLVKSARKSIKNNIKSDLIKELTSITGKQGQDSKKLAKEIKKGSKQLAKKLSKEIKIDKSALVETTLEEKAPGALSTSEPVQEKVNPPKRATGRKTVNAKVKTSKV